MNITEPEDIIVNFLRANLSELTRLDEDGNTIANRQTLRTETFDGDDSETEFVMTNNTTCFKTVSVGGTELIPYQDYQIDINNKKVTFTTAPATGTDNIEIIYYSGTSWIYPDKPRETLNKNSYPRISVVKLSGAGIFTGLENFNIYENVFFQIDILSHKDLICQIDTEEIASQRQVKYLARKVQNCFQDNWKSELIYKSREFEILNNYPVPFDENNNIFRETVEIRVNFRNMED